MRGRHRSGAARRHLVAALLAAAFGRGHRGRHRLASAALGWPLPQGVTDSAVVLTNAQLALVGPAPDPSSRQSVAPRLSVVRTPTSRDLAIDVVLTNTMLADRALVDTLPHPVLVLLPPRDRDEAVYATVDAERDAAVTAELARGADVRAYRPRHTA